MRTSENFKKKKEEIIDKAKKAIEEQGYFTISSCDAPNWDKQEHFVLLDLYHNPPEGLRVNYIIKFEVYDWNIMSA